MRFRNLKGQTDLPIDAIKHRFRNEHVLTVLPIHGAIAGREAVLVATPTELAVVIADTRWPDHWMTYLAPWEVVWLGAVESEAGIHRLPVHVDGLALQAELWGPQGAKALRDFVVAAGAQHEPLVVAK